MIGLEKYVGEILDDKYRLEQLLGSGGMGAVYLATHLGTERYVALKLIAPQFMPNEEFVERFKREARAAGRLRHPNVVDVTDFGFAKVTNGRVAYLVMEYLDGCTLGDVRAEEQRLPLDWVVDILEQVCSAVHEAHQQGIIHRDLKPDNIWLEPTRLGGYRVKVLDFGIAKLGEASVPMLSDDSAATIIDGVTEGASQPAVTATADSEKATLIQSPPEDGRKRQQVTSQGAAARTSLYDVDEDAGTRVFAAETRSRDAANLTAQFSHSHEDVHDSDGTLLFHKGTQAAATHSVHATTAEGDSAL